MPPPPLKGLLTPLGAGVAMAGGLKTETIAQVCVARSEAGTAAVICVAVTLEAARVVCVPFAFQFTVEPPVGSEVGIKLLPVRVNMRAPLPGAAEVGEMESSSGRGFGGGLITNAMGLERPLFPLPECGLKVLTLARPGLLTSDAGTAAVKDRMLELASNTGVVTRLLPFHWTTVLVMNPEPNRVMVKFAEPAPTFEGDKEMSLAPVLP